MARTRKKNGAARAPQRGGMEREGETKGWKRREVGATAGGRRGRPPAGIHLPLVLVGSALEFVAAGLDILAEA